LVLTVKTAENLTVEGIILPDEVKMKKGKTLVPLMKSPVDSLITLACAHALVRLVEEDGGASIIGDPMEKNTLESSGFTISAPDTITHVKVKANSPTFKILRRFAFSSLLKRMSTVSQIDHDGTTSMFIACKGAPETIITMLANVPEGYTATYKYWARRGSRVLALACKRIPGGGKKAAAALGRDGVESKLDFAGFLVFSCPLKADSKRSVKELNGSSHRVFNAGINGEGCHDNG
jgi:cation-transporting ATPase 13A1